MKKEDTFTERLVSCSFFCSLSFPAGPGFQGYPTPSNMDAPPPTASVASPTMGSSEGLDSTHPTHSPDSTRPQPTGLRLSEGTPTDNPPTFTAQTFSPSVANQQHQEEVTTEGTLNDTHGDTSADIPSSELIRQRRLQRFNSQPVPSTLGSLTEDHSGNHKQEEETKDSEGDK